MSIIRCFNCEHQLDSDFVEFHEYGGGQWCDDCYNKNIKSLEEIAKKLYLELAAMSLFDNPKGARGAK